MRRMIAVLMLALTGAVPARAETLADALASAYRHSGLLDQNRALLRAADEDVAQAVAALRPVLSYSLSASRDSVSLTTTGNLEISASLTLFDFGRRQLRIDVAKENVLSLRQSLISVEQSVLQGAVAAYTNVLLQSAMASLRTNGVRVAERELKGAKDRVEVGQATRTDVALAEASLASVKNAEASAKGALQMAREEYLAAMGHYPNALTALPELPDLPKSLAAAKAIAVQNHPSMKQARHSVKVADLNVALAKAGLKPTLGLTARAGIDDQDNQAAQATIALSGPIYQGGILASIYRRSAAQASSARSALHATKHSVEQQVANAWIMVEISDAGVKAAGERVRASRVAFRSVTEEERLGSRTVLDVISAEQDLLDAEAAEASAITDRYQAVYGLLASMGLLTVDHLKLGIPTYDPTGYYNAVKNAPVTNVSPEGRALENVLKLLNKK